MRTGHAGPVDPLDPRSVARWAADRVYDDAASKFLWVRTTIDGPGYMLTELREPRGGMWTRVCLVDLDDAARIAQRGPHGWPALCRLAERIEETLRIIRAT